MYVLPWPGLLASCSWQPAALCTSSANYQSVLKQQHPQQQQQQQ